MSYGMLLEGSLHTALILFLKNYLIILSSIFFDLIFVVFEVLNFS